MPRTRSGGYRPLRAFLSADAKEPDGLFYAQARALARYLLDGPFPCQVIACDVVHDGTCLEKEETPDAKSFETIIGRYGLTLDQFEQEFVNAYRKGETK